MHNHILRIITLSRVFIKEQLKEPIALFWIMASPCAVFYMILFSKNDPLIFEKNYIDTAAWFFAYVASSVALFGFSFYIIGRRESGFIRSFIYTATSKRIFFISHFLAYSTISLTYCCVFYFSTRPLFGSYDVTELYTLIARFYLCYLLFCIPGLLLTLAPLNFQSAHATLSITSFTMLGLGLIGSVRSEQWITDLNKFNPITIATSIMLDETTLSLDLYIISTFCISIIICNIFFRTNPVWNRY